MVYWFAAPNSFTFGASGAIFGLMGALLVVAIKVKGNVQSILGWIGLNFLITLVFVNYISWQGHLGGFLGGLAIAGAIVYAPRERRTRVPIPRHGAGGRLRRGRDRGPDRRAHLTPGTAARFLHSCVHSWG